MHAPFLSSHDAMCHEVLHGLRRPQKTISSKYFYDGRGCELFDRICELPEYYPTRTELQIMRDHVTEMAERIGAGAVLIEYGSGSSVKTRLLLDSLQSPAAYLPLDIASDHLQETAEGLRQRYPQLTVLPVAADFTRPFQLPADCPAGSRTIYFPGSTIGNLPAAGAVALLKQANRVAEGGGILLGIDLVKDHAVLEAAYNDAQGVTAEFNLNLLTRLNREIGADFELSQFRHHAFYNEDEQRIEMHLVSLCSQQVHVAGEMLELAEGETILTELSHKYDFESIAEIADQAGLQLRQRWTDSRQWFAVVWLGR